MTRVRRERCRSHSRGGGDPRLPESVDVAGQVGGAHIVEEVVLGDAVLAEQLELGALVAPDCPPASSRGCRISAEYTGAKYFIQVLDIETRD